MDKSQRTVMHNALVEAGVHVYESGADYQSACAEFAETVNEARAAMSPKEFDAWHVAEFGSGGSTSADGYVEGSCPHAWRAKGMLAQRAATKDDKRDPAADRLNTWLSACRAILRKMSSDATFTWSTSFDATKRAAQAKSGNASNRKGTGKKDAETPSDAKDVIAIVRTFARDHLATLIEIAEKEMQARKDTIRAATLHAIRDQLIANSK